MQLSTVAVLVAMIVHKVVNRAIVSYEAMRLNDFQFGRDV